MVSPSSCKNNPEHLCNHLWGIHRSMHSLLTLARSWNASWWLPGHSDVLVLSHNSRNSPPTFSSLWYTRYSAFVVACRIFSCNIWDLALCPGIEPGSLALGLWSVSHWINCLTLSKELSYLSHISAGSFIFNISSRPVQMLGFCSQPQFLCSFLSCHWISRSKLWKKKQILGLLWKVNITCMGKQRENIDINRYKGYFLIIFWEEGLKWYLSLKSFLYIFFLKVLYFKSNVQYMLSHYPIWLFATSQTLAI